jgi:hypothetical protein
MRDGISLVGKTVSISNKLYIIRDFYYVPGSADLYVGLECDGVFVNYRYEILRELIKSNFIL